MEYCAPFASLSWWMMMLIDVVFACMQIWDLSESDWRSLCRRQVLPSRLLSWGKIRHRLKKLWHAYLIVLCLRHRYSVLRSPSVTRPVPSESGSRASEVCPQKNKEHNIVQSNELDRPGALYRSAVSYVSNEMYLIQRVKISYVIPVRRICQSQSQCTRSVFVETLLDLDSSIHFPSLSIRIP